MATRDVNINVRVNNSEAQANTAKLSGLMREVAQAIKLVEGASLAGLVMGVKSSLKAAEEYERALYGLASAAAYTGNTTAETFKSVKKASDDGLISIDASSKAMQNYLNYGFDRDKAAKMIEFSKDFAAFNRQGHLTMDEAVKGMSEGIKNEISAMSDQAGMTKNISKIMEEYALKHNLVADKMTQAEKVQAIYTGTMKEHEAVAGNAIIMQGTYAGAMAKTTKAIHEASVALGESLAPTMSEVVAPAAVYMLEVFKAGIRGIQEYSNAGAYYVTVLGTAVTDLFSPSRWGDFQKELKAIGDIYDENARKINGEKKAPELPKKGKTQDLAKDAAEQKAAEAKKEAAKKRKQEAAKAANAAKSERDRLAKDAYTDAVNRKKQIYELAKEGFKDEQDLQKSHSSVILASAEADFNTRQISERTYLDKKHAARLQDLQKEVDVQNQTLTAAKKSMDEQLALMTDPKNKKYYSLTDIDKVKQDFAKVEQEVKSSIAKINDQMKVESIQFDSEATQIAIRKHEEAISRGLDSEKSWTSVVMSAVEMEHTQRMMNDETFYRARHELRLADLESEKAAIQAQIDARPNMDNADLNNRLQGLNDQTQIENNSFAGSETDRKRNVFEGNQQTAMGTDEAWVAAQNLQLEQQGQYQAAADNSFELEKAKLESEYRIKMDMARQNGQSLEMIESQKQTRLTALNAKAAQDRVNATAKENAMKTQLMQAGGNIMMSLQTAITAFSGKKNKELFMMTKAYNIASAIVNTAMAATQALAAPPGPPWSFAYVAAAVAAGVAQIATISSQEMDETGGGAGAGSVSAPTGGASPGSAGTAGSQDVTAQQAVPPMIVVNVDTAIGDRQWLTRNINDTILNARTLQDSAA
jgi:hypothetical protein